MEVVELFEDVKNFIFVHRENLKKGGFEKIENTEKTQNSLPIICITGI